MNTEKADFGTRMIAALIDGVLTVAVGFIPVLGVLVGAAYMLLRDGIFAGRSLGKKLMNLQVVTETGAPATYVDSVKRNAIFAIPSVLMILPIVGRGVAGPVGLLIIITEVTMILREPDGRRMGDRWAGTHVVKAPAVDQAKGA